MRARVRLFAGAAVSVLLAVAAPVPAHATYPGTNGLLAFGAETKASGYEVFTVALRGGDRTRITNADGDAVHPDWSPDGSSIVFELDHPSGPPYCSVVTMDADGTDMVDLSEGQTGCEQQPSYTPDGSRIVFVRYDDALDRESIWSMDLTGGDRVEVTDGIGKGVTDPNVSPDGGTISFIAYNNKDLGQALYSIHTDGTHLRKLVPFRFDVATKHDWSPDGERLVFSAWADDFSRSANVATVRPDGAGMRYLTHFDDPEVRGYVGGYSPDGRRIVFRKEHHGRFTLLTMAAHGGRVHTVIPSSTFRPRYIDWGTSTT